MVSDMTNEKERPAFLFCVCTGKCPGFATMDIWDFINRVRMELPVKYGVIHPQLCEEDGDRYLESTLNAGEKVISAGCAPAMQYKLFRDAFEKVGLNIQSDLIPLDVRDMTTDQAFEKVRTAMKENGYDVE
jgi:heterodisulfide reductase subunit A-like polyferredoxin